MVSRGLAVALYAVASCSPVEGTVLVAREVASDAQRPEADAALVEAADATAADGSGAISGPDPTVADRADAATTITSVCRTDGAMSGFFEEFARGELDSSRWLVAHGYTNLGGRSPWGGFARENVSVEDGALVLRIRGDAYSGPVRGVSADGLRPGDGVRSAAAVATRDLFASATYNATFTLRGPPAVEVGLWLLRDGDELSSIEITSPSLESSTAPASVRTRTRRVDGLGGEGAVTLTASSDGRALHSLRFDWYTNGDESARFWVDDRAQVTSDQRAPEGRAGRMWLVALVADDQPAAFDTAEIRIDRAFITPFGNMGDRCSAVDAPPVLGLP